MTSTKVSPGSLARLGLGFRFEIGIGSLWVLVWWPLEATGRQILLCMCLPENSMTLEFESVSKSGLGQVLLYNLLDAHGAVALE